MHNAYFPKAISWIASSKSSDQKYQFLPYSNNFNIITKNSLQRIPSKKSLKKSSQKILQKKKILQKIPKKVQKIPERCLGGNFVSLEVW